MKQMTHTESILDQDPSEKNGKSPALSYASVTFGIVSLGLIIGAIFLFPSDFKVSEAMTFPMWLPTTIKFSFILGLASTIGSFVRKEPATFWKWFGLVVNGLILLTFIGIELLIYLISCKK